MFGSERNIRDSGPRSINNTGDGNTFVVNPYPPKNLNRTYLYDFCYKFAEIEDPPEPYDTELPSNIQSKMNYNEINAYRQVFFDVDHYYDDVELILEEIPKRERILSSIKGKYDRFKRSTVWGNKDELCDLIYDFLMERVENDESSNGIIWEDVELGIKALMYYAFVKCKLLDPVPKSMLR